MGCDIHPYVTLTELLTVDYSRTFVDMRHPIWETPISNQVRR